MSFRRLLDREILIVPRTVTPGAGSHGEDLVTEGDPIGPVKAGRKLAEVDEVISDRDAQGVHFVYTIPARLDSGELLTFDGYARIHDVTEGRDFEVRGEPNLLEHHRRRVRHHFEVTAYRLD